ncbi:cytochrome c oxidase assembly factor 1 family protein [Luteimonas sp. S4-F44]|uniref:cytochrome c oxidase assembly factor Coa1 family protein n=1 Tax=Luteimonas sp. S4-F44 TaxID=2925842 RepID=UPI001F52D0B4|nr:cytochrome c oxidase assembly factor Coa1 family protein [Luteimonas sp. S4-F44]UNK42781.1 cytochrome c oxidase assembly factor 1 family protein [Luteimonas sp. S4-F44]
MSAQPPPLPAGPTPAPPGGAPPRGWWQRHWKWALPVAIVAAIALVALAIAALLFGVRSTLVGSDVYQDAVARARANHDIIALIGEPMAEGFMPTGSINTSTTGGGSGEAELTITLTGPDGDGTLVVEAERKRGQWRYASLVFLDASGRGPVTLVDADAGIGAPAIAP